MSCHESLPGLTPSCQAEQGHHAVRPPGARSSPGASACGTRRGWSSGHPRRLGSRQVEAIKIHHLVPGRYEVTDELLLRV